MYRYAKWGYTREGFNRTAARAQEHGQGVAPWVALGAGFVRDMAFWHWDYTYDFPVIFSWKLGQELNQGWFSADWRRRTRFADWRRAQEVVIYPSPFDPSCAPRANSSWKACFQVRTQRLKPCTNTLAGLSLILCSNPCVRQHFVAYARGAAGIKDLSPV